MAMASSLLILATIAVFSLIAVRVGALALMMTGLGSDSASFQAYSAFFGVGFTTREAELVVNHPVRRRIIRDLILVGNLGLMSGAASVVASFVNAGQGWEMGLVLVAVIVGALVFRQISRVGVLRRLVDAIIRRSLRQAGFVRALDYELLLRMRDGYCVSEVELMANSPYAGRTLRETRPADAGLIVLGIQRANGEYIGAPGPDDRLEAGDAIMIYGTEAAVHEAVERQGGGGD